jgi:SAM-dependent methyltransferase
VKRPFGADYSNCYDALYAEKDYEAECDLIERLLRTYSDGQIDSILDLGCGTGNHALRYPVEGMKSSVSTAPSSCSIKRAIKRLFPAAHQRIASTAPIFGVQTSGGNLMPH